MEKNNQSQLADAIATLSRILAAIEVRSELFREALDAQVQERKGYLAKHVELLIPEISAKVLHRLRTAHWGFVTPAIEEAFQSNRKVFGLFERSGYQNAMTLLQVQLSSYLVRIGYGDLPVLDNDIVRYRAEQATLFAKGQEVIETIKLLQKCADQKIGLTSHIEAIVTQVANAPQVAQSNRQRKSSFVGVKPTARSAPMQSSASTSASDDDLWLYYLTDIPTSMRTLLIDAVSHHRHEDHSSRSNDLHAECGQGHAHPGEQSGEPSQAIAACDAGQSFQSDDSVPAANDMGSAAAAIATDDSLGRFS